MKKNVTFSKLTRVLKLWITQFLIVDNLWITMVYILHIVGGGLNSYYI